MSPSPSPDDFSRSTPSASWHAQLQKEISTALQEIIKPEYWQPHDETDYVVEIGPCFNSERFTSQADPLIDRIAERTKLPPPFCSALLAELVALNLIGSRDKQTFQSEMQLGAEARELSEEIVFYRKPTTRLAVEEESLIASFLVDVVLQEEELSAEYAESVLCSDWKEVPVGKGRGFIINYLDYGFLRGLNLQQFLEHCRINLPKTTDPMLSANSNYQLLQSDALEGYSGFRTAYMQHNRSALTLLKEDLLTPHHLAMEWPVPHGIYLQVEKKGVFKHHSAPCISKLRILINEHSKGKGTELESILKVVLSLPGVEVPRIQRKLFEQDEVKLIAMEEGAIEIWTSPDITDDSSSAQTLRNRLRESAALPADSGRLNGVTMASGLTDTLAGGALRWLRTAHGGLKIDSTLLYEVDPVSFYLRKGFERSDAAHGRTFEIQGELVGRTSVPFEVKFTVRFHNVLEDNRLGVEIVSFQTVGLNIYLDPVKKLGRCTGAFRATVSNEDPYQFLLTSVTDWARSQGSHFIRLGQPFDNLHYLNHEAPDSNRSETLADRLNFIERDGSYYYPIDSN